jgi:hypothetical protein
MLQVTLSFEEAYSAEDVTNMLWQTKVNDKEKEAVQQVIINGERPPQDTSFSFTLSWLGEGRVDALQTKIPAGGATPAMNILAQKKTTIPGYLAGVLARTAGNKLMSSPAVKAITGNLPPVLSNIFVSGANVALSSAAKTVTETVSATTASTNVTQIFGRSTDLPNPPPVTG